MTDTLARARSAVDKGIRYGLGFGGTNPTDPLPCRPAFKGVKGKLGIPVPTRALWCDCSGFVSWVIGRSRKPSADFKWWLSTDSIWSDTTGKQRLFTPVDKAAVKPGDIAVYPDYRDASGKKHEGHTAIVSDPDRRMVVDCGSTSGGVTERVLSVFWARHDAVFCRYKG